WDEHLVMSWVITDEGFTQVTELRNGVLIQRRATSPVPGSTTFTLTRPTLIGLVTGTLDMAEALADGTVVCDGDAGVLGRLVSLVARVDTDFAIVTP
ncbi:MAG TPA: alkyl sulfatase C-terminal domain-containing protein, partial [Acidimicrobiales bacterium]|nr:alkyl sulfatase C-terminal domain-containing protein [Acidimicrobiales bacterium]